MFSVTFNFFNLLSLIDKIQNKTKKKSIGYMGCDYPLINSKCTNYN